jgi:hypothetical protein
MYNYKKDKKNGQFNENIYVKSVSQQKNAFLLIFYVFWSKNLIKTTTVYDF